MSVQTALKKSIFTRRLYQTLKNIKESLELRNKFSYHGTFKDRSAGADYLCIVLAGYKEFLYPATMSRLKRFAMQNMDICIITSGKFLQTVDNLCRENNWSYLSTRENNVSLVQNAAIHLHPKARYIYKLDEDIFITEHYFENMLRAYHHAEQKDYLPGAIAPLIPLNGYGHVRILAKLHLTEQYAAQFELPLYAAGADRQIESNPAAAAFFWDRSSVPSIDEMNTSFSSEALSEYPCAIRFSIGAILFTRAFWEEIGYFSVNRKSNGLGDDEIELCSKCCLHSRPIMVSENVVVGHLSFGLQNASMEKFFKTHTSLFL